MSDSRRVTKVVTPPEPVVEGAGVHLGRSIGTRRLDHLDPFLLLDHFESTEPADYRAGFPYHPHRGIETVTIVRKGEVQHRDSLGHQGSIGAGDIQWMTSGSGILHEEMPQVRPEGIAGLQLWLNLPAREKMTRPEVPGPPGRPAARGRGRRGRAAPGDRGRGGRRAGPGRGPGRRSQVRGRHAPARRRVPRTGGERPHRLRVPRPRRRPVRPGADRPSTAPPSWSSATATSWRPAAGAGGGRFLLAAARPLGEPIARYGPFVMNTRAEIEQTLEDLRTGRFIREEPGDR